MVRPTVEVSPQALAVSSSQQNCAAVKSRARKASPKTSKPNIVLLLHASFARVFSLIATIDALVQAAVLFVTKKRILPVAFRSLSQIVALRGISPLIFDRFCPT